jgi:hypothetical protein
VGLRAHSIGREAHRERIAASQVNEIKGRPDGDRHMRIGGEIVSPENERSRIAVLSVANNGLQEGHLKGLADIVDAKAR